MRRPSIARLVLALVLPAAAFTSQRASALVFQTIDVPGAKNTYVTGIYAHQVVGQFEDAVGTHGFIELAGNFTTLDDPAAVPGGTYAQAIYGSTVVGFYFDGTQSHGFSETGGVYTTLIDPDEKAGYTFPYGIYGNNVVGYYIRRFDEERHGFLENTGAWSSLTPSDETTETNAHGVFGPDNDPTIVGDYVDGFTVRHGFSLTGGIYTDLDVPGASATSALGINQSTVVGYFIGAGGTHGFAETNGDYLQIDDPNATQGTIAYGVFNSTLVGYYTDGTGIHGFITTIPLPEPASAAIICAGAVIALRRR